MSLFNSFESVKAESDSIGGYQPLESGIYSGKIKTVYITTSSGGAMAANLIVDIAGREYREQLWITNRDGKNYYVKNNEKIGLPGFSILNDICIATVGKELRDLDAEPKIYKIYDFEAKAEMPKEVPTIVDLLDQEVDLGIFKEVVDKTAKNALGKYEPTGETKEQNVIGKVFQSGTRKTISELTSGKEATFHTKWEEKYNGIVRNKVKGAAAAGNAGAPQKPMPATKPLF